jgi:hypothetical protein
LSNYGDHLDVGLERNKEYLCESPKIYSPNQKQGFVLSDEVVA